MTDISFVDQIKKINILSHFYTAQSGFTHVINDPEKEMIEQYKELASELDYSSFSVHKGYPISTFVIDADGDDEIGYLDFTTSELYGHSSTGVVLKTYSSEHYLGKEVKTLVIEEWDYNGKKGDEIRQNFSVPRKINYLQILQFIRHLDLIRIDTVVYHEETMALTFKCIVFELGDGTTVKGAYDCSRKDVNVVIEG